MKRLFIILLILCPLLRQGMVHAQIYSTSSSRFHSYTNGGMATSPSTYEFQSTSVYGKSARHQNYSTAPMFVANGTIKTIASTVTGGMLTDNDGGYIPPESGDNQGAVISGVPDLPLGDGCDVFLFLGLLSILYAMYLTRKISRVKL